MELIPISSMPSNALESATAVAALAALAHESRLAAFRLLVQAGPQGMNAGELALRLGIPSPTLSFHLKDLVSSGLVGSRRQGRFVRYAPDLVRMAALMAYLTRNCCEGGGCEPTAMLEAVERC
jgi:ArsR family transcriptional regulator, arsenate/arsenite/antimonite-responsive transcriptional repressor